MKKELINFEGGINNLLSPHLIPEGTSPYIANTNIIAGVLEASKEPKERADLPFIGKHTFYYRAKDMLVGSKQYTLLPLTDEDRFYIEWGGFLYWSNYVGDGTGKLKRFDGTTVVDLGGQVAPTVAPTLALNGTGLLYGSYSYCYTYLYNDVFESAPSPIVALTTPLNHAVDVTLPAYTGTATHTIIYRSGGLNPTFNQVAKVVVSTTVYRDNTSDFNISRKELNTTTNDAPPADIDMLVESFGTLFGAVKNRVHFSREGQPEYWSNYNYVELPTTVMGLGVVGENVIAFTEENMYAIAGRNIQTISIAKLPYEYGCLHKRTVKTLEGNLVWLSQLEQAYLICSFSGGNIEVLNRANAGDAGDSIGIAIYNDFTTETYDDFSFGLLGAISIGRKYMLFLSGRTVIVDLQYGLKIYYMIEAVLGAFEYHNTLIVSKDSGAGVTKNYQYTTSNAPKRDMNYTTKDFADGSLIIDKSYRKVSINAEGNWSVMVFVDSKNVFEFDHTKGNTIFLPSGIHGKVISFKIKSKKHAKVLALQYEYEILSDGFKTK